VLSRFRFVLAVVIVAAMLLSGVQYLGFFPGLAQGGTELLPTYRLGTLPATDPASDLWAEVEPLQMPMSGQTVVEPRRPVSFVESLEVRALYNATHIAFRLSWPDAVKDNRTIETGQFRDAVAIQVAPASATPYLCMGAAGVRLQIMQWKADWQADLEEGFKDLEDAFPNFWSDYYPFAIGGPPYRVPEGFSENASVYLVGYEVGNPFSQPLKVTAVEDAAAEGFFTITTQARQDALGRGLWSDGRWGVVITRALVTGDSQDVPIANGAIVAFAVWDGSSGDVGARKSVSTWATLNLGGGAVPSDYVARVAIVAGILLALVVGSLVVLRRKKKGGEGLP